MKKAKLQKLIVVILIYWSFILELFFLVLALHYLFSRDKK